MNVRSTASALLLFALPLAGCNTLKTLQVTPAPGTQKLSAPGQKAQYHAIATYQMGSAAATNEDVTNSANWSANNSSIGTINSSGLATGVSAGNTIITATLDAATGSSDLTVDAAATPAAVPATLSITPGTGQATVSVGQTVQFVAIGNLGGPSGINQDLTSSVQWVSSNTAVATITPAGLATGVSGGNSSALTLITAIATASNGAVVTATSSLSVSAASTPAATPATLTIIPASDQASTTTVGETTQFLAVGNLGGSAGTQNLTSKVQWISSDVGLATISQSGLATGIGASGATGIDTITAIATAANGSIITANSTLTIVNSGSGTVTLPTLTVYTSGLGSGSVTSSPAGISCSSSTSASCTGYFTLGSTITLTAAPATGSSFAGWSSNCTVASGNPNSCTIVVNNNNSVGAIFNTP